MLGIHVLWVMLCSVWQTALAVCQCVTVPRGQNWLWAFIRFANDSHNVHIIKLESIKSGYLMYILTPEFSQFCINKWLFALCHACIGIGKCIFGVIKSNQIKIINEYRNLVSSSFNWFTWFHPKNRWIPFNLLWLRLVFPSFSLLHLPWKWNPLSNLSEDP